MKADLEPWNVNDVDRYARDERGLADGDALFEQQEHFERGRLVLHWRCIAGPDQGQEGDIPASAWGRQLGLARDRDLPPQHGRIDYATGALLTAWNDGRVFVEQLTASSEAVILDDERKAVIRYVLTVLPHAAMQVPWGPWGDSGPAAAAAVEDKAPRQPTGPRKHDWLPIHTEIFCRCIDKSGRLVVPKNQRALARQMLQWCEDNNLEMGESTMREAVDFICAALRKL
jgi:hypothetical protein